MALSATFYPSADAEVKQEYPDRGGEYYINEMWVGWEFGGEEVHSSSLVKFDLSSISHSTTVIASAKMRLYVYREQGNADLWFHCYRITSNWGESTVTYNTRPSINTSHDFSGRVIFPDGQENVAHEFNLNTSYVQNWARSTWTNYGLYLLRESHYDHANMGFRTRQWSTASQRPLLSITYYFAPYVSTGVYSGLGTGKATFSGNITSVNGYNCSVRGFQYGLSQTPTWSVSQSGSFATGGYSLAVTGLYSSRNYYYRAFATNPAGTSYGDWQSFHSRGLYCGMV